MHTTGINLIANQVTSILGHEVNIYNIRSIKLDGEGHITAFAINIPIDPGYLWIEEGENIDLTKLDFDITEPI